MRPDDIDPLRRRLPGRRLRVRARSVAITAGAVAVLASLLVVVIGVGGAQGGSGGRALTHRIEATASARARIARARTRVPVTGARGAHCTRTAAVPALGRACRTREGLYARDGVLTHGPDLVRSAASPRRGRSGGFGTTDSIVCSTTSLTRHVLLAYVVPSDGIAARGDRYAEIAPLLRQSLLDAATLVDRTAGERSPGARRRLRVQCDDDGQPTVARIVLPRSRATYASDEVGFFGIGDDLAGAGWLPDYDDYASRHVSSVRRLVGYYDADFVAGVSGEASMYTNADLVKRGVSRSSPLVSKTSRNINNNPPSASLALVYGHSYDGVPDPPTFTTLLHELSHTMGAVQDEPPTSSQAGHCTDGLDVMCYDDQGPRGAAYVDTTCPQAGPAREDTDERYDCNGDTYFHPAPPSGNPLTNARTWNLGLVANETLLAGSAARPAAVTALRASGSGTNVRLRWGAVAPRAGRRYEVSWRPVGTVNWTSATTTATSSAPPLRPRTRYEFAVGAIGSGLALGPRAHATRRTGVDTTRPTTPTSASLAAATRTAARLRVRVPSDNVGITRYRIERRVGGRWVTLRLLVAPRAARGPAGSMAVLPAASGLAPGTTSLLRIRAQDARGNRSLPSRAVRVQTRR